MREHKTYVFNHAALKKSLRGVQAKADFEKNMRVSLGAVYNWCSGRTAPSERRIAEIAALTGRDVSDYKKKR